MLLRLESRRCRHDDEFAHFQGVNGESEPTLPGATRPAEETSLRATGSQAAFWFKLSPAWRFCNPGTIIRRTHPDVRPHHERGAGPSTSSRAEVGQRHRLVRLQHWLTGGVVKLDERPRRPAPVESQGSRAPGVYAVQEMQAGILNHPKRRFRPRPSQIRDDLSRGRCSSISGGRLGLRCTCLSGYRVPATAQSNAQSPSSAALMEAALFCSARRLCSVLKGTAISGSSRSGGELLCRKRPRCWTGQQHQRKDRRD